MAGTHDGRYAPSPTGELHLGNLRTALLAWLFARAGGGSFRLRIDDLDPDRSRPQHEQRQLEDLRAIGIDWDGEPVRQTDRFARYHEALEQLAVDDRTYPCFCTRAEVLAAATAPHGDGVEAPYPGTCSRLAPSEARARVAAGEAHCIRVRAQAARLGFDDLLLGHVDAHVDDFIVRRRDGVPAYNLASPVDESDLEIGQVVRGSDLAPTTPRQIWVARQLGLRVPTFAHVPLVLGPDGARLAKRHGAASLGQLAADGIEPARVVQLLAETLGLDDTHAPATAPDLLERFDPASLPREDVRVDPRLLVRVADRESTRHETGTDRPNR